MRVLRRSSKPVKSRTFSAGVAMGVSPLRDALIPKPITAASRKQKFPPLPANLLRKSHEALGGSSRMGRGPSMMMVTWSALRRGDEQFGQDSAGCRAEDVLALRGRSTSMAWRASMLFILVVLAAVSIRSQQITVAQQAGEGHV